MTAKIGRTLVRVLATGGGLGYSPLASGTVGTLPGIVLGLLLLPGRPWPVQLLIGLLLSLIAVPICGNAERQFGKKDDGRIVADEYLTFPLCLIGLPLAMHGTWLLPAAFLTCRFCDIVKPWPAGRAQSLPGGPGIVADDVLASLYSLGLNHLILLLGRQLLGLA